MTTQKIGIIGGGPAALFLYQELLKQAPATTSITLFEKQEKLGAGMPYSGAGAELEHVTNVSDNEIPNLPQSVSNWVKKAPGGVLQPWNMDDVKINEYKVLPRLLFGEYLSAQFELLLEEAKRRGLETTVVLRRKVTDLRIAGEGRVFVTLDNGVVNEFNTAIICTGHTWPQKKEGKIPNWFDSPYPPRKLHGVHGKVAIKGASLTAIDAVRTLALQNGRFERLDSGEYRYRLHDNCGQFRLVLHSLQGMLPAVRFHLNDTHLRPKKLLSHEEALALARQHGGFIPLDIIFERYFREGLRSQDPGFFEVVQHDSMEEFVERMLALREQLDAITLLRAEMKEAETSIRRHKSIVWKEMLGALSFAMSYPAKYYSAEDTLRMKKVLMPLISLVIAYMPQSSCRELLALHQAGVLRVVSVDTASEVIPRGDGGCIYRYTNDQGVMLENNFDVFVDATGQAPVDIKTFPFTSLVKQKVVCEASVQFRNKDNARREIHNGNEDVVVESSGLFRLTLPGVMVNDAFQPLNPYGIPTTNVYIMAVPLIAGIHPDYSGLDFCETAAQRIARAMYAEKAMTTT